MLKKLFLLVTIAYTIVLIIFTFINLSGVPSLGSSFDDKIYHVLAYSGLAFLWVTLFKNNKGRFSLITILLCLILFGAILEILQNQLNPNRTYDNLDLIANCFGILLGTLIADRLNIIKLK